MIIRTTIRGKGITGLYSGCSALVVGNAVKHGVRFVSYDHFKNLLADSEVSISVSSFFSLKASRPTGKNECAQKHCRSVIPVHASVSHCVCLSSWFGCWDDGSYHRRHTLRNDQVSMPFVSFTCRHASCLRTKPIDDAKRPNPQYRGLIHGAMSIVRQEGITGVYRGLFPVVRSLLHPPRKLHHFPPQMMRQGANSAVGFTTYTTLKQFALSTIRPSQQLPNGITFGIGAVAGLVTVCVTQPLECVDFFFSPECLFDV